MYVLALQCRIGGTFLTMSSSPYRYVRDQNSSPSRRTPALKHRTPVRICAMFEVPTKEEGKELLERLQSMQPEELASFLRQHDPIYKSY